MEETGGNRMKQSKTAGFAVILIIYVFAVVVGLLIYRAVPDLHIFWRVLLADAAATVFVYLTGVIFQNASVYDPYWSLAPIVILTGITLIYGSMDAGTMLLLAAVWYWGIRLTCNWAYTFKNLATQDWRYDYFKKTFPRAFQLISFFGINMFPTIVVYLCLLPGIIFIQESALNIVTVAGFAICITAATLQLFSDIQMHRFRRRNAGNRLLIRDGLWKHARHPNYLGEILMWWGVYAFMLSSAPQMWFLGIGPLVNTLMFIFISIPMADRRNRKERSGFDDYYKETNMLLPVRFK